MKARAFARICANGRLTEVRSEPPLTLRRVGGDPGECALCLVGSAAGPLAGDDLRLDLELDDGARARLTATGAALAQGRGQPALLSLAATVGSGGSLRADPGALVVAEDARVDVTVTLDLAVDATVQWRELVVLGRSTDARPGVARIRWDVVRAGRPVLRQLIDSIDLPHRVMATVLVTGPDVTARTVVASPTAVAQRIDEHTALVTVLGDSAAAVNRQADDLLRHHGDRT